MVIVMAVIGTIAFYGSAHFRRRLNARRAALLAAAQTAPLIAVRDADPVR